MIEGLGFGTPLCGYSTNEARAAGRFRSAGSVGRVPRAARCIETWRTGEAGRFGTPVPCTTPSSDGGERERYSG